MTPRLYALVAGGLCWLTWHGGPAIAFDAQSHKAINERAADEVHINDAVTLDEFLKNSVGFVRGFATRLKDVNATTNENGDVNDVVDWLRFGGAVEDRPDCRSTRHFHDPLQPWSSAGLSPSQPIAAAAIAAVCGNGPYGSSVLWGQTRNQAIGEQRSWFEARDSYWNAVTAGTQANRDQNWASMFQTLGQLMHLIADASVPEHVRNDTHILSPIFRFIGIPIGSYEGWVETHIGQFPLNGAPPFDRGILRQATNSSAAPVPIARLIDTRTYTGSGAAVTLSPAIGIAEFTSANFFSADTGNRSPVSRNFPFPSLDLLGQSQHPAPYGTNIRRYYSKGADGGIPVDPALAECVFDNAARAAGLAVPASYNCVDENVWAATARLMVPRAVDYAAGLLEYFFRGQIEIAPPGRFAYGLSAYQPGNAGVFTHLRFKVRNITRNEDAAPGQIKAIVQYRRPLTNASLIANPMAALSAELYYAVSAPVEGVALTSSFQELVFDFTENPLPANSADLFLMVVFRGRLGLENDAVLLGGKDLFEPDPLDFGNASDWECFNGALHPVADMVQFPPYQPPGQTQRDIDRDGVQDLTGPALERGSLAKMFRLGDAVPVPSPSNFDMGIAETSFAEYGRLMLLQDQPAYGAAILTPDIHDIPSGATQPPDRKAVAMQGIYNHVIIGPNEELMHLATSPIVYRGVPMHHAVLLVTPATVPCLPQTPLLAPDLVRIPITRPAD